MNIFSLKNWENHVKVTPINRSAKTSSFCVMIMALSALCMSSPIGRTQEAFDSKLAELTNKIAEAVTKAELKAITVTGFTDVRDKESDLGLFLADELSADLVEKGCSVVDRRNVDKILAEHKLSMSGLVDPETAKQLGQFAGLDAIVIGTITPLNGTIRLTVKVIATDSAKVLAAASSDIPKSPSIRRVMGETDVDSTPEPTPFQQAWRIEQPQTPTLADGFRRAEPATTQQPNGQLDKPEALIVALNRAFDSHDWQTVTEYTVDGYVNYFGHSRASNNYIRLDMQGDARTYRWNRSITYPETFTHQVSAEYSPHWSGPMIYDSMNFYSEALENNGRSHNALVRLTVGYTLQDDQKMRVYALVLKVLLVRQDTR